MSEAPATKSIFDKSRRAFLMRKLHSLSGVLPVGGFMVFHLWENSRALQGREQFDEAVAGINHMPYLPILECGILLPLVFHAVYGVRIALDSKPNVGRYTFSRNWMYTFQRVTGLLAFAFIAYHLYEYWGQKLAGNLAPDQFYWALCRNMGKQVAHVPYVALIYIFGIGASVFHFANGLWGFCFSWGITVSRRSQRAAATLFGLAGLALFLLGANTAIFFATGARLPLLGSSSARTCPTDSTSAREAERPGHDGGYAPKPPGIAARPGPAAAEATKTDKTPHDVAAR